MAIIGGVKAVTAVLCASILLLGCKKDIQNKEAVRQGVIDYFAKRQDLSAMDVAVSSVSFRQDEADAMVYVTPKGSPGAGGMQMKYLLERKNNRWVVKGRSGSAGGDANPHGGSLAIPQGLPPGHPSLPASPGNPK